MTLSVWRYAHLLLAIFSVLFLIIASATGIVLAIDAAGQKISPYRTDVFHELTVAEVIPTLQKNYLEVTEINVNHNEVTTLKGLDDEGNEVNAYINPVTGKTIGTLQKKSELIQWVTSLHRSLFLHETGRFFMGVAAFLLMLIAISGIALVLQRQKGLRRFFGKVVKEYFSQYYHVVLGRLLLIPILIIALSGTYLSMQRFKLIPQGETAVKTFNATTNKTIDVADFPVFKNTMLAEVQSIAFPFDTEDPEEFFVLKLRNCELQVNQFTGEIVSERPYATTALLEQLNLNLHTGRGSFIWAIILGIAAFNILFFIWSGFAMTLRRTQTKIKNKYKPQQGRVILLVGSENGSTLRFAGAIHNQLLAAGQLSFLGSMNNYCEYPNAEHIVVFTATHGLGDAPHNANKFISLVQQHQQRKDVKISVVGFGSKSYPDFCGFALNVHEALSTQSWATVALGLHTVDDKSCVQFTDWVKNWCAFTGFDLSVTPATYAQKPSGLQKLMVLEKSALAENDHTFSITLRAPMRIKFTSGDLLAVYPANDARERLYSISRNDGNIRLAVRYHEHGLGSEYLYGLTSGAVLKARIVKNAAFHFPKKAPVVVMIANGTGIAPFLGMIEQNKSKTECYLYSGFRNETETVNGYKRFAAKKVESGRLTAFHVAFSREQNHCYVTNLIQNDADFFAGVLRRGGVIMLCGSLSMQQDTEILLDAICMEKNGVGLAVYKAKNQLKADCY